jgi:transcriptional regulator with XRE-family HTH domain
MREMRTLSRRVAKLRRDSGLTKTALAEKTGLSTSTISRIESAGETLYNPHLDTLAYLAHGLGVKVGEITNKPVTFANHFSGYVYG